VLGFVLRVQEFFRIILLGIILAELGQILILRNTMKDWYILYLNPGIANAMKAEQVLSNMGVHVFLPMISKRQKRSGRVGSFRIKKELLFPGYMFVKFDFELIFIVDVESCTGTNRLLRFGGKIATISDSIIENIRLQVEEMNSRLLNSQSSSNSRSPMTQSCRNHLEKIASEPSAATRGVLFHAFLEATSTLNQ